VAFKLDGSAGGLRLDLQGDAGTARDAFTVANLSKLMAADVRLAGHVEAREGSTLVALLGVERLLVADKRPGRLDFSASGPLDGDMAVDGQVSVGSLNLSAKGKARIARRQAPTAGLDVKLTGANLRSPRTAETLPLALTARLDLAENTMSLSQLTGKIADSEVSGRLSVGLSRPIRIDGDLTTGAFNLPGVVAAAVGLPASSGAELWPSEPFEAGLLGSVEGHIKVKSARMALTPALMARDVEGVFQFDPSELAFEDVNGTVAGGRISGGLTLQRGADGLTARSHIGLAAVNLGELLPAGTPLSGQLALNVDLEGSGRSARALIGALQGGGTFTLQDGRIGRLDPSAFDAVIRNVDQGLPIDTTRIRDRTELALGNGALNIPLAEGEVAINSGQVRFSNVMVRAERADLAVIGSVDLGPGALDAKLTLSGPAGTGGTSKGRPEIGIVLKGAIAAPNRTLDVAGFASWLALRAVEQQAKRLEALESVRGVPEPAEPPTATVPPATALVPARPARTTPETRTRTRPRSTPPAQSAAPKPPPVDVRPQWLQRFLQPAAPRGSSSSQNSVGP
jgi:hypothetical protein